MTSCPAEEDLVLFVEGAPSGRGPSADEVADHLTACAACRGLVARSEAALRYALGGVADRERRTALPAPTVRRPRFGRTAAAAAALAAAAAMWATARDEAAPEVADGGGAETLAPRPADPARRLDDLLARAERLAAAEPSSEPGAALAALAAADARLALGMPTAAARLHDVVERFPGTPEAREARARLAQIGDAR